MKNLIIIDLIIALLCLSSCNDDVVAYYNNNIFLEGVVSTNLDEDFSDMGYQIEKHMLILPDSIFLSGNSHVIYISQVDSSFFATDGKLIFRFDKDGDFRNKIGVLGHGPMEYQNIYSSSFDSNEEKAYIYAGNNTIYAYSFEGLPTNVVELESNGYVGGAYRIKDGFWAESLSYDKGKTTISIITFNNIGRKTGETVLASFDTKSAPDYYPSPIVNQQGNLDYHYYSPYTSQLYNVSSEGINSALTVEGGKFKFDGDKINDMDFKTDNRDKFIEMLDIHNSEDAIYLLYTIGRKFYAAIIDKKSGECVYNSHINNPIRGGGIVISEETEIKAWPQFVWNNNIYSILYEENCSSPVMEKDEKVFLLVLKKINEND